MDVHEQSRGVNLKNTDAFGSGFGVVCNFWLFVKFWLA